MGLRERLTDPWALAVGALAGGMTWAVIPAGTLGAALGAGVGVAVYGAKVLADVLLVRHGPDSTAGLLGRREPDETAGGPRPTELPAPPRGTDARRWLDRAEAALEALDETVESAAASVTREQVRSVRDKAATTVSAVRRLAGQATAFEQALNRIQVPRLAEERARLERALPHTVDEAVRAEREAALASIVAQLEAAARLQRARETALARLQSTALGLESLDVRAVELLAMAASSGDVPGERITGELSGELEALRAGVQEAERLARGQG